MSYINKTIASDTAFNMLQSTREKIESKEKELSDLCEKLVINSYDPATYLIIKSLEEGWIQKRSGFYFTCKYGKSVNAYTTNDIKCKFDKYTIEISPDQYEKIIAFQSEIKKMKDKMNGIKQQIIASLLKLRTAEKIKKEFPEAYKNLPKNAMSSAPLISLPIEKILSDIETFPA